MNTKRIVSLFASLSLVLSMSLGLTGCGDKAAQDDNQGSTDGESTKYTVGICQLVQHEALDAATQGFIDALNEALPGEVEFQTKNASGDSANCSTIVNGFVSDKVDLIMANATGALTAAAAATPIRIQSQVFFFGGIPSSSEPPEKDTDSSKSSSVSVPSSS